MLTREEIRKMTQEVTYKRGSQIYYSKNRIPEFHVSEQRTATKRSIRVRDIVDARVRTSPSENCRVRLEYDRESDALISATCQCLAFTNLNGICKHCVAVLMKYAEWQQKQKLYIQPAGNFERIEGALHENTDTAESAGQQGAGTQPAGETWQLQQQQSQQPEVPLTQESLPQISLLQQETRKEDLVPREETTPAMKVLLGKQTRKRTAPVTEQLVHGRVRIEPVLHLGPAGDKVEFRIGVDRMYVMKDVSSFAALMSRGDAFSYGKNLSFTHTMESIAPESRALVRFILARTPIASGTPVRHLIVKEQGLEELMNLTEETGIHIVMDAYNGRSGNENLWQHNDGWPEHLLTLTGEYPEYADGSENRLPGKILGLRGQTEAALVRLGRDSLFAFDDYWIYRMNRKDIDAISDWLKTLPPKPERWDSERFREYLKTKEWTPPKKQQREFFIEKSDLPAFCRELLPAMERVFHVERKDFSEEDFEMARASFKFYLDAPAKDVITCRAVASYGDRMYAIYRGIGSGREAGFADRDLVTELSVWQALEEWLPVESNAAGVSERLVAADEDAIYRMLTDGVAALQNMGEVLASDALMRISVRPAPKVSVGVSLAGDMLNLTMEAEGLSRAELAEVLTRYDKKKKYHRLKNGDFIRIEDDELAALADMQEGMGFSEKELRGDSLEVPRFRALYLDKQMCSGAMDGIAVDRSRDFKSMVKDMRTVDDNDFEVPESLRSIMREYQKHGFLWLKTLSSNGFGGILADDMGLGKTLQVISFLLSEHEDRLAAEQPLRPALIVCPASLVYNWESEIQKFAPALKTRLIVGSAPERKTLIEEMKSEEGEICITSYELLRRDIEYYENLSFGYQVIDEAQYIKNHYTKAARAVKKIRAGFKVALTGTPIENRLAELWSIFDYIMPGFLYSYDQFQKRLERPIVTYQNEEVMDRLQRMIGPFVLRRLKKDVLRDLPDKIEEDMLTRLEGEQRDIYDAQVQQLRDTLNGQSEEEFRQQEIAVLAALTRLRQICCDPGLVFDGYEGSAAKVDMCMELIETAREGGHKMLIFSQFTSLLAVLEERLNAAGIPSYKLEGATPKKRRMEMVEAFNREDDTTPVFLISLKAGGTGLNLTAADVVIHFDPWWNLAVQNQATDRAHRIGQKQVVNVYKLIARDTIEENIMRLQERKRQLADQVLGGSGLGTGSFSREELLEILG